MLTIVWESQFKRDFKTVTKRGKKMENHTQTYLNN